MVSQIVIPRQNLDETIFCFRTFPQKFFMPASILKNLTRFFPLLLLLIVLNFCYAQPTVQFIRVVVVPDHADWTYAPGEKVKFNITVLQSGNALKNAVVKYEIGPEKMDPVKKDSLLVANGTLMVD